jgi:hypothetical protein
MYSGREFVHVFTSKEPPAADEGLCPGGAVSMSQAVLTWTMSAGFLAGFLLTGYHAHVLLHLGLGHTLLAMFGFVSAVLAGLMLNLWFMAGQRYVLEFLALYEPTSGVAEWVHDTVFGISQERIDAAYRAGSHQGRSVARGWGKGQRPRPARAPSAAPRGHRAQIAGLTAVRAARPSAGGPRTASRTCSSSFRAGGRPTRARWGGSCTCVFSLPRTRLTLTSVSPR